MKSLIISCKKDGFVLGKNIKWARNFFQRFKGLMGQKELLTDDGLLIESCNSIHTCFMNFPIDVIFINKEKKVLAIYRGLKPWRMTKIIFKATQVLELKEGAIPLSLKLGDELDINFI